MLAGERYGAVEQRAGRPARDHRRIRIGETDARRVDLKHSRRRRGRAGRCCEALYGRVEPLDLHVATADPIGVRERRSGIAAWDAVTVAVLNAAFDAEAVEAGAPVFAEEVRVGPERPRRGPSVNRPEGAPQRVVRDGRTRGGG